MMQNLGLRDFSIESLAAPFDRWPLLMACVASALLSSIVVIGTHLSLVYVSSESVDSFLLGLRFMSDVPGTFLGAAVFQWCWTTGMIHTSRRHLLTFFLRRNFWQCCLVNLAIAFWLLLVWIAAKIAPALFTPIVRMLPESAMLLLYYVLAIGSAFLIGWLGIWVTIRLMLWSTFIIAEKKWCGLLSVWQSTAPFSRLLWSSSLGITIFVALGQFASWFVYWAIYGNRLIVNGVPLGSGPTISVGAVGLLVFVIKISIGTVLFAAVCSGLLRIYRFTKAPRAEKSSETIQV